MSIWKYKAILCSYIYIILYYILYYIIYMSRAMSWVMDVMDIDHLWKWKTIVSNLNLKGLNLHFSRTNWCPVAQARATEAPLRATWSTAAVKVEWLWNTAAVSTILKSQEFGFFGWSVLNNWRFHQIIIDNNNDNIYLLLTVSSMWEWRWREPSGSAWMTTEENQLGSNWILSRYLPNGNGIMMA